MHADLIVQVFGPNGQRDVPGHQEIEMESGEALSGYGRTALFGFGQILS